jgi:hypothetical protein
MFKIKRTLARAVVSLLVFISLICSDSLAAETKSSQSSGLKASIGRISVFDHGNNKGLAIQVILTNVTKNRIYVFLTGDAKAALSDGNTLSLEEIIGVTYCRMLYPPEQATAFCMKTHGMDLDYYSYVDPEGQSDLLLRYMFDGAGSQYTPDGSLSFRLIMITRVAHTLADSLEAQADPKSVAAPQIVILNFPLTQLGKP